MLFSRPSPRQSMVTLRAWVANEQGRLPGRVAGPDDVDVEAVRARGVAARRAVEDALAREAVGALDREPPPRDAAGEDDRPGPQHVASVQVDVPRRPLDPRDRPRHEDLGPEPLACASAFFASSSPDTPDGKPR